MPADPDGLTYPAAFAILALLFVIGIIYSSSESYIFNLNDNKLRKDAENGSKPAGLILKVLKSRRGDFSSLQLGMVLSGILFCSFFCLSFTRALFKITASFAAAFAVCVIASFAVFFIFADFIPKKLTAHRAGRTNYGAARFLWIINGIMTPALLLMDGLSNLFLKIFGFDPDSLNDAVTEEEIMMLVGESEESGAIEENEKDMIENIFDFNDTTASEIMTHRIDIAALPDTATIREIVELSVEEGFSRIPVYHEDIDSVTGIFYVKDLLPYVGRDVPGFIDMKDMLRPAYFIPESKKCSQLFSEMKERKVQIAVIVDEYGGTSGLVTLEDLVESILGNIQDEYDNEEEEILLGHDGAFTVDGGTSIDEISELTDTELPEGDYDTIAGFMTAKLGRILREDERPSIEIMGLEIKVAAVEDQRISKLIIKKLPDNTVIADKENSKDMKNITADNVQ